MEQIKSCPFCGSEADVQNDFGRVFWVQCKNFECGSSDGTEWRKPAEAVASWNRRALPAPAASEAPTIDTPEFGLLLDKLAQHRSWSEALTAKADLIAHIDQHVAAAVKARAEELARSFVRDVASERDAALAEVKRLRAQVPQAGAGAAELPALPRPWRERLEGEPLMFRVLGTNVCFHGADAERYAMEAEIAEWRAMALRQPQGAVPDHLLEFVEVIADGGYEYGANASWTTCGGCGVETGCDTVHEPDCIVLRAKALMAAAKQAGKEGA